MSIYLYRGGEKLVGRSGVGQAIRHQADSLIRCGLTVTDRFAPDTDAVHINTVLRDIPVYDGWLEDGKTVYKASNTDAFQRTVMNLLAGDLPDLTAAGRQAAEERSLEAVGERLKDIYRRERILPPLPAPISRRRAKA